MVIIRPTASLAKLMKVKTDLTGIKSTTLLGDWFAINLTVRQQKFILCVSENGRLPIVLKAAPYGVFPARLPIALSELLRRFEISEDKIQAEASKMSETHVSKTNSRSILGSMNDFRFALLVLDQTDPIQMSLFLSNFGSMVLPDFTPRATVMKLFD